MDFSPFHFDRPVWLWALLSVPVLIIIYAWFRQQQGSPRLAAFADKHLLPHLLKNRQGAGHKVWRSLTLVSAALACGIVAMAGPQWRYTNTQAFRPANDLVILLDMSQTMNAADVKPSRLIRAREEISDLLDMSHGLTVGLIAYAAVPHMVAPLTDDMNTLRNLLPSLDTSLITIDGDNLKPALEMAARMLGAEPGHDKSILVVSDGNFAEKNIGDLAQAAGGAKIYTMGIGTDAGAPVPLPGGGWVPNETTDEILISHLQAARLRALSAAGNGSYVEASYNENDTRALLDRIGGVAGSAKAEGKTVRTWEEGFYVPALILAGLLLPWFCKGALLPAMLLALLIMPRDALAADIADWFRNTAQQGQVAFAQGHYDEAAKKFSDPYQQGVAAYKAGQYGKAEALFQQAGSGPTDLAATYNLGNAQLMQSKPEDAIASYEAVLKQAPDDVSAKHNLEIAKKLLQQQQQQKQPQQASGQNNESEQQKASQQNGESKENKDGSRNSQQQEAQQQGREAGAQSGQAAKQQTAEGQSGQASQAVGAESNQQPKDHSSGAVGADQRSIQNSTNQEGQAGEGASSPSPERQNAVSGLHQRTAQDINADQWLNHIQSDPGSFLKNQFMIEEQENGNRQEIAQP